MLFNKGKLAETGDVVFTLTLSKKELDLVSFSEQEEKQIEALDKEGSVVSHLKVLEMIVENIQSKLT